MSSEKIEQQNPLYESGEIEQESAATYEDQPQDNIETASSLEDMKDQQPDLSAEDSNSAAAIGEESAVDADNPKDRPVSEDRRSIEPMVAPANIFDEIHQEEAPETYIPRPDPRKIVKEPTKPAKKSMFSEGGGQDDSEEEEIYSAAGVGEIGVPAQMPSVSNPLRDHTESNITGPHSLEVEPDEENNKHLEPEFDSDIVDLNNFDDLFPNSPQGIDPFRHERALLADEEFVNRGANAIGELLAFHLNRKTRFYKRDIAIGAGAVVIAGASLALYWSPTREYAHDDIGHQVIYLSSVMMANFGVSAFMALKSLQTPFNNLPVTIRRDINADYRKNKVIGFIRLIGVGTIAVLTSLPYALAAEDAVWVKLLVGISNSVMNFYSVNNLMLEHGRALTARFTLSDQKRAYYQLNAIFNHTVRTITRNIIETGEIPDEFRNTLNLTPLQTLRLLAETAKEHDIQPYIPMTTLQIIFRRIAPGTAGVGLVLGLLIYLLKSYETLYDLSHNDIFATTFVSGVGLPFLYAAATFGAVSTIKVADALTCNGEKPLAMQLYPKTTIASMVAITTIVSFSFATVANFVLNDRYFSDGGPLSAERKFVVVLAAIGAIIFNNFANQKLAFLIIETLARYFGSQKELATFGHEMENFLKNVNDNMSQEAFLKSLSALNDLERIQLLPMLYVEDSASDLLSKAKGEYVFEDNKSFLDRLGASSRYALGVAYHQEDPEELENLALEDRKKHAKYLVYGATETPKGGYQEPEVGPAEEEEIRPRTSTHGFRQYIRSFVPSLNFFKSFGRANSDGFDGDRYEPFIEDEEANVNGIT